MSARLDGLGVAYGLAGFVLLYSGWSNQPVKSTLTGFLKGSPPKANPTGAVQLSLSNPDSSSSGNTDGNANIPSSVGSPTAHGTYSYKQLETLWVLARRQLILAPTMAAIAEAESSGNVDAHNPSGASGLWQIEIPVNDWAVPGGASNVYNALDNARAAVAVYKAQGLTAWTTYSSGAYRQFLQG